uniref:Sodium channel protein Nach n=2 Tax=Culex pipiens TaxID=7175 RepID=A0A8D8FEW8_CULPI
MASLVNFDAINATYTEHEKLLGKLGYNPQSMLLDLNQPCPSLIRYCYWLGQEVPCDKYFHVTKTHLGFCCSFNVVPAMLVGNKATQLSTRGSTDIRLSGAGKHVGLSVTVDIEPQNYMAPTKSFFGADVFLHSPIDFPADSDFEDTLQPGWDVDFCVTPMPIDSSDSLRRVPLKKRQCFMEGEGTVQSGSSFSSNLCMSECRLRTIVKLCNCVPFFFADFNISETEGVQLCTLANVNCLRHFRKDFYSLKPPRGLSSKHLRFDLGMDCDCMPSCSFLNYQVQSISSRRKAGPFAASSYFGGRNVSSFATLHVHFKDLYCVKYRRDAFMTWDVLLAAFGGIFGLCMGGSVLSVVELLYYFFVKPVTFYKQDQKRREARGNVVDVRGRSRIGQGFQPGRYPVGYFDRKKVIMRDRMSAKGKKKGLGISPFGSFSKGRQINEPETIFLY